MTQGTRSLVQFLVLGLVAAGLGGYAWFGILKKDEHAARQKDHDMRLFAPQQLDEKVDGGIPPAAFQKLVVDLGESRAVVERNEQGAWELTAPVHAPADKLVIDAMVSYLQTAKFKTTLDEHPDAATLQKYGLDHPKFVVAATAVVDGQRRSVKLAGGIENTFDGSVYVQRNDEPAVYTAEGGARFTLARGVYELRDKFPLVIDEKKVKTLELKAHFNAWALEREGPQRWKLTAPKEERADQVNVGAMLGQLGQAKVQRFLDGDAAALSQLGQPTYTALVAFTDGHQSRLKVLRLVGDAGDSALALREDDDGATTLAEVSSLALALDRNLSELTDKTVVQFQPELVSKMVLHDPAGPEIVVQKDAADASAESWRVVQPVAGKARVFKLTGALWTLGHFKALAWGEKSPKDWAKYGIDETSRWIAVYGDDGRELARLTIGKLIPETPSGYYVRGTRDQVVESDGSRFTEFPFTLDQVLDGADGG